MFRKEGAARVTVVRLPNVGLCDEWGRAAHPLVGTKLLLGSPVSRGWPDSG